MVAEILIALALAPPAPRIDSRFPPAGGEDRRRPDLTQSSPGGPATHLAFTADGRTLATLAAGPGGDRRVRLWNGRPGKELGRLLRTLEPPLPRRGRVLSLGFSAEGRVAVALPGGRRLGWDSTTGALAEAGRPAESPPLPRAPAAAGPARTLAVSRKGTELATADVSGDIRIWDVASGKLLAIQEGHRGPVLAVAFNPNGQKLVSSGRDGTLRTWTVPLPPLPAEDLAGITAAIPDRARSAPRRPRRLLVFWRAEAILHKAGVPAVNHSLELLGRKTGAFEAHFSRDYEVFSPDVLSRYDAIVLNSTAHLSLPDEGKRRALLDYVRGGGGVVGIHAAIDMFKDWPEGAAIVGATFAGHPWGPSGTWRVKLDEPGHPLVAAWGGQGFTMKDELYELGPPYARGDRRVLLSVDLSDPATAAVKPLHREDRDFAVSWIKPYGRGRVFYAMFGHVAEPFHDPRVQRYYLDGIQYVLGDLELREGQRGAFFGGTSPSLPVDAR